MPALECEQIFWLGGETCEGLEIEGSSGRDDNSLLHLKGMQDNLAENDAHLTCAETRSCKAQPGKTISSMHLQQAPPTKHNSEERKSHHLYSTDEKFHC